MERAVLSLKKIYMLLMTDDFPMSSQSVISKRDRKGQTLMRFWQRQVAQEFRSLPYGRMIWRDDKKRNHFVSYICNRSMNMKYYQEYAKELSTQISTASLLDQIGRFVEFLAARNYKHEVLFRRVQELMRIAEREDEHVSAEIARQIRAAAAPALQREGRGGELFQAGYLLMLLTLYALAGEAMDDPVMAALRGEEYSLEKLWQAYAREQVRSPSVEFLTVRCSLLQDTPLPRDRFFGRDMELFDLWEIAAAGRKCIISGVGGIGKTELLRQLLRRCEREATVDRIAVVPYIGSLVESFARAFPGFYRQEPEEEFHSILYQMEQKAARGSRILLLIDDLDKNISEDPALGRLESLHCGVIITARQQYLEGFEVFRLGAPAISAGMLIFRDNYGLPLTAEDREALADLLADDAFCYPATLRLMAKAARGRGWSVSELKKQLKKNSISFSWQEEDRTVFLSRMYRQLYSYMDIPKGCRTLAELFTLLPRDYYSTAFLQEVFPDVAEKAGREASGKGAVKEGAAAGAQGAGAAFGRAFLEQGLAALAAGGWLEYDGSGYSMHPLIAQCLRRRTLTEKRLEPVLGPVRSWLLQQNVIGREPDRGGENYRICHIFLYICRFLSGNLSRDLVHAVLTALIFIIPTKQEAKEYQVWLERLLKHCPEKDDRTEVFRYVALGHLDMGDAAGIASLYSSQKKQLTVPKPLFLEFCIVSWSSLVSQREFALAEQLLKEGLDEDATPFQKAAVYHELAVLCEYQGDLEKKHQWAQTGMEYVTAHPECGDLVRFMIMIRQGEIHVQFRQKEPAQELLKAIRGLLREDSPSFMKNSYENLAGAYELTFGSLEQALVHYSNCLERAVQYSGRDTAYFGTLGQVAIVLQRLGRYEEAISAYHELLEYAHAQKDIYMSQRFHNNLGVLYLEMGNPGEALRYLPTALEKGRKLGGIALAEALRNTARAYRLLGDAKRELRYCREAAPLLREVYGPDHPRAREAGERLAELQKICK